MIVFVPSGFERTCCGGRTVGSSNSSSSAQLALLQEWVSYCPTKHLKLQEENTYELSGMLLFFVALL